MYDTRGSIGRFLVGSLLISNFSIQRAYRQVPLFVSHVPVSRYLASSDWTTKGTVALFAGEKEAPTDIQLSDTIIVTKSSDQELTKHIQQSEEEMKEANLQRSYFVLVVLFITFASNQWSRQAMFYLCDFSASSMDEFKYMNRGLDFSKEMYAALASFGFTLVFAITSLFSGNISDKYSRGNITTLSCLVWSLATGLQAFATSFNQLVPLRAIIGASQSFYNPAAYTLLADLFPARMVGSINGIFSGGIYLGGALASLSIVLNEQIGWRSTLLVIGGAGLLATLLCFMVIPEPRNERKGATSPSLPSKEASAPSPKRPEEKAKSASDFAKEAFTALKDVITPYQAKLLFTAAILRFCAGFSIGIWKAPFIFDKFPGNEVAFSGSNALIMTVGGLSSTLLGGYLSDILSNPKDPTATPLARSWVPAVGRYTLRLLLCLLLPFSSHVLRRSHLIHSLVAAPLFAGFILAENPQNTALFLLAEYLFAECWFGPTLAGASSTPFFASLP